MTKKWRSIRIIELPGLSPGLSFNTSSLGRPSSSLPLVRLCVQLAGGDHEGLHYLIEASQVTLRHLDLGIMGDYSHSLASLTSKVMEPIVQVAPRLHSFKLATRCYSRSSYALNEHLSASLSALKEIRHLELGLQGFKLSLVLPTLQSLEHLSNLSITEKAAEYSYYPVTQLTTQATTDFILAAPSLKRLTLPHQLEASWFEDELEDVQEAAKERGVIFKLA